MSKDIEVKWRHKMKATSSHSPEDGWRSVLAWWLRRTSDLLDGGQSVRLKITTDPDLETDVVGSCVMRGLRHADSLIGEMAHQKACEMAMREANPELYGDEE